MFCSPPRSSNRWFNTTQAHSANGCYYGHWVYWVHANIYQVRVQVQEMNAHRFKHTYAHILHIRWMKSRVGFIPVGKLGPRSSKLEQEKLMKVRNWKKENKENMHTCPRTYILTSACHSFKEWVGGSTGYFLSEKGRVGIHHTVCFLPKWEEVKERSQTFIKLLLTWGA